MSVEEPNNTRSLQIINNQIELALIELATYKELAPEYISASSYIT